MSDNKPNLPQKPVTPTLHKKPIPLTPLQKKECGKIKRKGDTSAVVSPSVLKGHSRMYVISRTTSLFYPSLYGGRFTRERCGIYGIGGIVFNIILFALLVCMCLGNDESVAIGLPLYIFVEIIFFIFYGLPVTVKRIHDLGYSAIFPIILMFILSFIAQVGVDVGVEEQEPVLLVLAVVSILGSLGLIIWIAFSDSQEGANRYGDSEKYPDLLIRIREAIRKEDTEKVKQLLKKKQLLKNGAATDIKNKKDKEGMTPLYVAVQGGNTEIVKLLIEAGADVNKADDPFYWALGNGHTEIVKLLIEAGADVNKANKYGNTPLTAAARCGHTEIVKLLIEAGADVNANNGMTPLQVASNNGHTGIVELLKQAGARE